METILSYFEFNFPQWLLVIFSTLSAITLESKNMYHNRFVGGVTIFLRLNGKVGKELEFNFKKEILELASAILSLSQFLIIIIAWFYLFSWALLITFIAIFTILNSIGDLSYRDPIYNIKEQLFDKLREKDFLFYFLDFIYLLFIIYFIGVLFF
tara:strand:- start:1443 stop:1904 length:462 start_codon:yes stop_codon:yes gene_type:complete